MSMTDAERDRLEVELDRAERKRKIAYALKVWDGGEPLAGSPAEFYLAMRGLQAPAGIEARFHPACPRERGVAPALIVLMRLIEGDTPVALQRIFLTKDYRKDGRGMMLGPTRGAAMKLIGHRACCTGAQSWFIPRLHICEGFETGLALLQLGYSPTWALGSAGAIQRLPLVWFVGQLVIAVDNDENRVGEIAAAETRLTWGWRASCIATSKTGTDFADLVRAQMEAEQL
jgi:hypothetical protein